MMISKTLRSAARPGLVRPFSLRWATDDGANPKVRATTILSVRKGDEVVMIGDGQVSMGSTVVKPNATKVRRLQEGIIAGYAGGTADALTLMELLETKLEEYPGTFVFERGTGF
jgi:20S proteasome alpha/beta subunit